ncbi:MAG: formylglycine-generating enzyme family protein [Deltaproteobacteria bacterium]|nr:formylglycine-generating enzyme family protein [Deltaproteobacteria bacterium]
MKKTGLMFILFLSFFKWNVIGAAPHHVIEQGWQEVRQVRTQQGGAICDYVKGLFREAEKFSQTDPVHAWRLYIDIERQVPEELVNIFSNDEESARIKAWHGMKILQQTFLGQPTSEGQAFSKFLLDEMRSLHYKFNEFYRTARKDSLNSYAPWFFMGLIWELFPYLATQEGAFWIQKIANDFVTQGYFLQAYGLYRLVRDYSWSPSPEVERKMRWIEGGHGIHFFEQKSVSAKEGLTLSDGTSYRLIPKQDGLWKTDYELQISFAQTHEGESNVSSRKVQKKIYDLKLLPHVFSSPIYGPQLVRIVDKIVLVPGVGEDAVLVFDLFGNVLEKKRMTKELKATWQLKDLNDLVFSEDFIKIPCGSFLMGNASHALKAVPVHRVTIVSPIEVQRSEATQLQWFLVLGERPFYFKQENQCHEEYDPMFQICSEYPAETVSWFEVVDRFIALVNEFQKWYRYRLPTEAEWEYFSRGGLEEKVYAYGDDPELLPDYTWYRSEGMAARYECHTHPVKNLKPNGFGLFDVHGNVSEWCQDHEIAYTTDYAMNPCHETSDSLMSRITRGGSYLESAEQCAVHHRRPRNPLKRDSDQGFRLVREPLSPVDMNSYVPLPKFRTSARPGD